MNKTSKSDKARERRWEVEDALSSLRRAAEIVADKKLMGEVEAMAEERAVEFQSIAQHAGRLAKLGRISPKQIAKLGR
jgi:hypothetical protein